MKNIVSKVNKEDMVNARIDRDRATKPPEVEPGMDDMFFDDEDDLFSPPSSSDNSSWSSQYKSSGSFTSSLNPLGPGSSASPWSPSGGFGSPSWGTSSHFNSSGNKNNVEEQAWEILKKGGKGFYKFIGSLMQSFKNADVYVQAKTGKRAIFAGGITAVIGLVLSLFGFGPELGFDLMIGGILAAGVGVPLFMFAWDTISKNGLKPVENRAENNFTGFESVEDDMFSDDDLLDFSDDSDNADVTFDDAFEDIDKNVFSSNDADDIDFGGFSEKVEEVSKEDIEKVLDEVQVDKGMVTRDYLFEKIVRCMPRHNQDFDKVRNIPEGSEEFDAWDAVVQNSASLFKPKGSDVEIPYLISAKDRLFYTLLEIKRVSWLKTIEAFVDEIVNICKFDKDTGVMDEKIYGIGYAVGDRIYVKIMKGETALVTVRDTYKLVEKDIKNPDNYMPIVLGLDPEGGVVWKDFKMLDSILVTGRVRSGKTWFLLSVLAQMMMFLKPSELNFYIFDPKGDTSDFRFLRVPHVRKFLSTDEAIMKELYHVVRVESKRRAKLFGEAGCVNIWDFKRKRPDIDMPLIYVIIDEVITLVKRMEKPTRDEFQALLLELISRLPAYGIRLFMVPHLVKDEVLKKTTTDLIPCRISVLGDEEHIERTLRTKDFKHKLMHPGDMAVRLDNGSPMFVHAAVLTPSNEGNVEFFDFLSKFWLKIEPESYYGSWAEQLDKMENLKTNNIEENKMVRVVDNLEQNSVEKSSVGKLDEEDMKELLRALDDDLDLFDD